MEVIQKNETKGTERVHRKLGTLLLEDLFFWGDERNFISVNSLFWGNYCSGNCTSITV